MSSIKLKGSTSGDVTITVPAQAGTNTVTIPAVTGTLPLSNLDHVTNRPNAKPIIVNGGMEVAQRGTSFTGQTGSAYTLDRVFMRLSDAGTYTITQDSDVPEGYGFSKSMKIDCTTANDSLEAADFIFVNMRFEKQDMRIFNKGTSSAKKITVAAWVKSPKTGTHVVGLYDANSSTNRYCMQTYTISSANTWTKAIVTFPADTGGDEMGTDNTHGMNLQFWFAAGSNFTSGSAATAWENYTAANQAVGQVDCSDSTDNNILITGMQMEVGEYDATTIPPFQHESYGDSLIRCQRYFRELANLTAYATNSTTVNFWGHTFSPHMRANPTLGATGAFNIQGGGQNVTQSSSAVGTSFVNKQGYVYIISVGNFSGLSAGNINMGPTPQNNSNVFTLDAEL